MRIFISSVEAGYQRYRAAAQWAVEALGHEVIRAEDLPTSAQTPQQGCLAGVRRADVVILLMGQEYGEVQQSGLSATHEEYREARQAKPVLVFVESGVERGARQQAFLDEVEPWATGHFRTSFAATDQLRDLVLRAVHDYELAVAAGPVDEASLVERARELLRAQPTGGGGPALVVVVAPGPYQQVLRPVELEAEVLARDVQREAMFGAHPVLDRLESTQVEVRGSHLVLRQRAAAVGLSQLGDIRIDQLARRAADRHRGTELPSQVSGLPYQIPELPALIEEEVTAGLAAALQFADWLLGRVDPLRRLTDVVPLASVVGAGYLPWRTRAEHAASPGTGTMGRGTDDATVGLTPARRHRQALVHDADRMAEDLAALLRREFRR
jgi:Domain of unknown function (DUF4062)